MSWSFVTLEELAADERSAISKPYGSAIVKEDYRDSGVPVVRGVNLTKGIFHDADFVFIEDELAARMPGAEMGPGDLVVTHRGTVGQVSMIPRASRFQRYVASTSHVKVRLSPSRAVPEFYYYWFASPGGQHSILSNVSTVGVPGLVQPVATVKKLRVPCPPLPDQQAIADVLGALDTKIAANERVVARADMLAGLEWQRAAAAGQSVALSGLAEFVNGKAFTKGASGTGRIVIRIAELNSGLGGSTVRNDIEVAEEHLVRPGDLLFAWSGSLTVARWFRPEAIVNQHIFKVIPKAGFPMWLVNQAVRAKLDDFKATASDKATTMGHIQRHHLDEVTLIPDRSDIDRLEGLMDGLWESALLREQETARLAQTRDELLPLLMSGKVRMKDAVAVAAEVV